MSASLIVRYRRWFEYEQDAHAKVLTSFDTIPADKRGCAEYRKAVSLLAHIVVARQVWLFRLGGRLTAPSTLFPENLTTEAVANEWETTAKLWVEYLARIEDADLDRVLEYTSYDGNRFRNCVDDILTQMFGHSWYHRGQIAVLVKAAGGTPAATDLVYWCREAIPAVVE